MYGGETLPAFAPWIAQHAGAELGKEDLAQKEEDMTITKPIINAEFMAEVGGFSRLSFEMWERI